ncbi:hypothetical protein K450DRAFT_234059 [Umbelopsis ramanniana AG]|uniref:Secreted protein n=1 Tax=Umbelopsis ramanniana AG TaxID=1314678 RepID=A0AAD5HE69_UMBRA|nr:uncharacterized protein K450DRAFT_234059 [Umbelopsis ramanniana AG]KAI8580982.1 hypothetical protein K450DRAFT_234059 [Umbelopsis ramanniana AG]
MMDPRPGFLLRCPALLSFCSILVSKTRHVDTQVTDIDYILMFTLYTTELIRPACAEMARTRFPSHTVFFGFSPRCATCQHG